MTSLSEELGVAQASVAKHLNVLGQEGLASTRREGAQAIYVVRDTSIFELCKLFCDGGLRHAEEEHAVPGLSRPKSTPGARRGPKARTRRTNGS